MQDACKKAFEPFCFQDLKNNYLQVLFSKNKFFNFDEITFKSPKKNLAKSIKCEPLSISSPPPDIFFLNLHSFS